MIDSIFEELEKRRHLSRAIDLYIQTHFRAKSQGRLKRGQIQEKISKEFGISLNNVICSLINERMAAHGFPAYIMKGTLYYRNISEE